MVNAWQACDIIKGMIKLVHSGHCKYIVKDSSFEVLTT